MVGFPRLDLRKRKSQGRDGNHARPSRQFDRLESRRLMTAGTAPTDLEQYMLELINRTRANPTAEGQRLLSLAQTDPLIHQATLNWNLNAFYQTISSYAPEPPLAFNPRLIDAALAETNAMLAANAQHHSLPGYLNNPAVAVDTDGQTYYNTTNLSWATGENIFAYSQGVNTASPTAYADFFEAGFLLDWGNPDFGHLKNILGPGPAEANLAAGVYPYSEIGIGLVTNVIPTTPAATNVGPAIVTQEFGWRQGNAFLTGTFYLDAQNTGFYAPGEGYGNVTIRAVGTNGQGTFQTQTWSTGGYSLQLPPGTYNVTASGPLPGVQTTTITIGADNVSWEMGFSPTQASDIPVPADYDGLGHAEVATYRPASGLWQIDDPGVGVRSVSFGQPGDIPVPGHYDGGHAEIAVYRPSNATYYVLGPNGPYSVQFGLPGDVPVPGDYDGDGRTDFAVYRSSNGTWYIWQSSTQSFSIKQWGIPYLDQPVPAAYDGSGRTEIAVIRPTTDQWFIVTPNGVRGFQFGTPGMVPVPADYDGIGRAEPTLYQMSTGDWFIRTTGRTVFFGLPGIDSPAPADYDGDGRTDFAVYRPSTSETFIQYSRGGNGYDQIGRGGTAQTFRSLGTTSLGVPTDWISWVASPGAEHSFGGPTTGTTATTATATTSTLSTVTPTPIPTVATQAVIMPKRINSAVDVFRKSSEGHDHAARARPSSRSNRPAHFGRSSAAKKA